MMRHRVAHGFTLIETVMASAVLAIVMLACMSLLTLSARSMNNRGRVASTQAAGARVAMDQLTDDLKVASTFSEQTASSVTFTVPDRTGDGIPETIRYALLNGNFTRQINGSSAVTLLGNAQAFSLAYATKTVGTMPPLESAQQTWAYYDGGTSASVTGTGCDANHFFSEYFLPTIPSGASSWKITHVQVQVALRASGKGVVNVQIQPASSSKLPTGSVLASAPLDVSQFPSAGSAWVDAWFTPPLANLTAGQGYCVVFSTSVTPSPCNVYFDGAAGSNGAANDGYATTPPASWSAVSTTKSLQFYLYGTYFTPQ